MALLITLGLIAGTGLILTGYTIGVYNTIQTAKNDYQEKWAEIKTEYQRRLDMIGNNVKTVKAGAKFEKETLRLLTEARTGINNNTKPSKTALKHMEKYITKLNAQFEAYPQLQSTQLYQTLMTQIENTENRIYESRDQLNEIARDYNTYISKFPTMYPAKMFNARKMEYFEPTNSRTSYEIDL